jgi:hypothetical protein
VGYRIREVVGIEKIGKGKRGPGKRKKPWMRISGWGLLGRMVGMEGGGGYEREGYGENGYGQKKQGMPEQGKAAGG